MSIEPWPLDSTKRSLLAQAGSAGLWRRWPSHSAWAISAIPIGAPGCPEFACWTASMARTRMASARARGWAVDGLMRKWLVDSGKPKMGPGDRIYEAYDFSTRGSPMQPGANPRRARSDQDQHLPTPGRWHKRRCERTPA